MMDQHGGLANSQYRFQKGKSTLGAVEEIVNIAETAKQGTHRTRRICVLIALDGKNAFNYALWKSIIEELQARSFPHYIIKIINR